MPKLPKLNLGGAWTLRAWAVVAGLAAGLAHPPFGFLPGLIGFAALLVMIEVGGPRPLRSAFLRGWLMGVGYFAVSTWWIGEPFLVDAATHGWMAPFAVVLLAAGLALFFGLGGLAYRLLRPKGVAKVLVFAGCFSAAEWLRGHLLTGFPWNLPGEAWAAGSAPSQTAALVGAYGLTWITLAIAATPAVILLRTTPRVRRISLALGVLALALLYGGGWARLALQKPPASGKAPILRVVQANIDQKEKWRPENLESIVETYLTLTQRPAAVRPDIVIWPEGALPAVIDDLLAPQSDFGPILRDSLVQEQSLLMGANRGERDATGAVRYFNSLVALRRENQGLRVTGVYDKHRLVPFGEYLPLGGLATRLGIRSLVHMPEDFSAGPPPRPLAPWGVPALQPLICYEALFPGFTRGATRREGIRPAWILNISNDAWFGQTSGPLQHLNMASYRAIEEGLPIVRATPTGVSAVIDAYGRAPPAMRLGLGQVGVIDAPLPPALAPTPYARFGEAGFAVMLLLSLGLSTLVERFRRA